MKRESINPNRLLAFVLFFFLAPVIFKSTVFAQGSASGVATFHSIGLYWSGSGGSAGTVCNVQYRVSGASTWKNGFPLVFDSRGVGGRPSNEYRGSLVNLAPGTSYEIQLTAGSASSKLTVSTWSENFPVGSTTTLSSPATISTSGTPSAYKVYTGSVNGGQNNIVINASYIIIRNMTLTGAQEDAILLQQNAHDVIIEGCDISGWGAIGMGGNNQAAVRTKGFSYNALGINKIVIQRNKIHDSRENSNSWDAGGHPMGPNGINFEHAGGNHVIRYNEIYTTVAGRKFMDGIGGADNFTFDGFPNANTDIYSNLIKNVYDDAIESEGGNCNVRIWGNFTDDTFTGIACATNSVGPLYIFRNVTNLSVRSPYGSSAGTIDNEDRGPFNKCGSQDATYRGGRTFLFHNTILQPTQSGYANPRGMGGGPVDNGGGVINVYSRNNIWQTFKSDHPAIAEWQTPSGNGNSYDYDLYNFSLHLVSSSEAGSHMINGTPAYASSVPVSGPNAAGYFLASGSNGVDKGQILNNFNDGFTGSAPDVGAYETNNPKLEFGVNAYLTSAPPTNQPPVVNAGSDITITLPVATATLNGTASDADGTIKSYAWTKISGPATFTLSSTTTAITILTGLIQGTYVFRLTVTDNAGATATDDVTITVNALVNVAPTANAGTDKTLTLPANSTTLNGSGTDVGGTITNYAWTKVSGPTTYTLGTANAATTTVSNLVQGTYVFRLTVTDNSGTTGTDDMTITVNPATNQAPTANAGTDKVLTLPANSTTLNGSGTDVGGTITSYAWTKISGPATYTLGSANAATTTVTNLVQGTYVFRLTVTDNNAAKGTDDVAITVNSATGHIPTANAGADKTLVLPANSTILNGSGSDASATISGYAWTKVSGPASYTMGSANAAITTLTNLVQGTYVFRITVTDISTATATDDVTITVNSATNQAPVANAGTDKTLTLPTNSVTLNGSGTDADGSINSYSWSRVSGPSTYTFSSATTATTTLTSLVQGTYVFRLTVTDNAGASATDDITVTVNAATTPPPSGASTGTASGVTTFECIGIYWSSSGGSANTVCNVKYRVTGTATWKDGYPLWFDNRGVGGRPANEYRGSLAGLQPGTTYEIQLTAGSAANTFTATTWSETFPVGTTQTVTTSSSTLNISTSGTTNAYRLYTPAAGQTATIDVANKATNCIYINASYVIVRGLIIKGAAEDAILLGPNAHDVVIENNDISGWGNVNMGSNNQAGVRVKGSGAANVVRIIIQRNKIHESRANSNSWDNGGHPLGPNGINFENAGGNHVIRYNEIYGNSSHYFMDGIGGADNFSFQGFPNKNTDIYGNKISQVYDDAIESEGANCNVRIWGNFMDNSFTGVATASTSIGPIYIYRNVTNIGQRSTNGASPSTIDNEDRGPFNKCGGQDATYVGGRTYLFHNTVLQPVQSGYSYSRGMDGGPVDNGGPVNNIVSRNNIWQTFKTSHGSIGEYQNGTTGNNYDYDLYNGALTIKSSGTQESNGIKGTPTYANGVPLSLNPAGYFLASGSKGVDAGQILPGFNDSYTGTKPDMGAYESGKPALQFGTTAYSTATAQATGDVETINDKLLVTDNATLTVYPNPTANELNLQYSSGTNGKFNISVYDANNKLVWAEMINKDQATIIKTIHAGNYPAGVYLVKIVSSDGKEKSVIKFVKM